MKYFTIKELSTTSTGLPNEPTEEAVVNLTNLVDKILDPLRELYGKPIYVNSGYRSPEVNIKVAGAKNSQHLKGEAADISVRSKEGNKKLFQMIANGFEFDQLIDEKDYSWIHVSLKRTNRKQILHLK